MRRTTAQPRPARHNESRLLGGSDAMCRVRDQIEVAAQYTEPALVLGETGVGKELVARRIHRRSSRSLAEPEIVNCAGLSPDVLASELFGHRRGAFTGADRDRAGRIRAADGSTLILDEISAAPPSLQATVLRAVEYGEVQPVGSDSVFQVDVRFVWSSTGYRRPPADAPPASRPWQKCGGPGYDELGPDGRRPDTGDALAIVEEGQRHRWPQIVVTLRAIGGCAHMLRRSSSTMGYPSPPPLSLPPPRKTRPPGPPHFRHGLLGAIAPLAKGSSQGSRKNGSNQLPPSESCVFRVVLCRAKYPNCNERSNHAGLVRGWTTVGTRGGGACTCAHRAPLRIGCRMRHYQHRDTAGSLLVAAVPSISRCLRGDDRPARS